MTEEQITVAELHRRVQRLESSIDRKLDELVASFADPQKSALGREVITRSDRNADRILSLERTRLEDSRRLDRLEGWVGIEDPPVSGRLPLITMVERLVGIGSALRIQVALLSVIATILGIWVALGRPGIT